MRIIKIIPSRSGLFRPFNVDVVFFVLFYVSAFKFPLSLCYIHVLQTLSNNQTYLVCNSDVFYIRKQNPAPKCKFQQPILSQTVKTVEPYECVFGPLGSAATPFVLILNE